jgi:hypothetical protein
VAVAVEIPVGESAMPGPYVIILQVDYSNDEMVCVGDSCADSEEGAAIAKFHAAEYAEAAAADDRPLQYLVVRTETLAAYAGHTRDR